MSHLFADINHQLDQIKPQPGESVENLARRGLNRQSEVYAANAWTSHIAGLGWHEITPVSRAGWVRWAEKKMEQAHAKT